MDVANKAQDLIDALKADKSMAQPYRNYALSDAVRLQALVNQGLALTNQTPPPDLPAAKSSCICPPLEINSDCPIHGNN